jgi:hypothetical protein
MNETILNFNSENQEFYINHSKFDQLNFREMSQDLFNKDSSHLIIKNYIDKDIAMKVRDFYSKTKNSESFVQSSEGGNHRMFLYENSPYKYPKFITSLLNHSMVIKNRLYEYHDYYQIYCMIKDVNPKNYSEVVRLQNLHSWSCLYWYKNGNSHFRHIDNYGELACFVNFTKKGADYQSGGIQIEVGKNTISLDDDYEYGDLIFLDQSQVFHEVLPIKTLENQVGRIQLYIPTIPPNYMNKTFVFEGYENEIFFTNEEISLDKKRILLDEVNSDKIHYSRKIFKHFQMNL